MAKTGVGHAVTVASGLKQAEELTRVEVHWITASRSDIQGAHSIRINDQFRICFVWTDAGVEYVEIVDYH